MAEDAFKHAREPKELFWIEGATPVGLYDKPPYVKPAVARLGSFYRPTLGA